MAHTEERRASEERGTEKGLQGSLVHGHASVAHIISLNVNGLLPTVEEAEEKAWEKFDQPI